MPFAPLVYQLRHTVGVLKTGVQSTIETKDLNVGFSVATGCSRLNGVVKHNLNGLTAIYDNTNAPRHKN